MDVYKLDGIIMSFLNAHRGPSPGNKFQKLQNLTCFPYWILRVYLMLLKKALSLRLGDFSEATKKPGSAHQNPVLTPIKHQPLKELSCLMITLPF